MMDTDSHTADSTTAELALRIEGRHLATVAEDSHTAVEDSTAVEGSAGTWVVVADEWTTF